MEFCGIKEVLARKGVRYKYFIFLNASVRGPFLPQYMRQRSWIQILTSCITTTEKLCGITINCLRRYNLLHLQSFLLTTDVAGLRVVRPLLQCHETKNDAIAHGEIAFSQAILKAGYNLASMMTYWSNHDFRNITSTMRKCKANPFVWAGDVMLPKRYFGMYPNPFELMFVKTNRGLANIVHMQTIGY